MGNPMTAPHEREYEPMPDPKALECRAEVESLAVLQHERRKIIPRYSQLAAKFKGGASASADTKRKQHRALVSKRILLEWKGDKPPAENALERMANADIEHIAFCDAIERDFAEYVVLELKIKEYEERIRSRETELQSYNRELALQR